MDSTSLIVALVAFAAVGVTVVVALIYLAPEAATRWFLAADRRRAALSRKEIVLLDGLKYVYLEGGQGPALMLLHGFGANKDSFNRVAAQLTRHYRVIVPDLIGFGESDHPPQADYTPMAQAERLRRFALALGVQALHLGGSSMGGQIAMTYAACHSAEVQSLWLLDAAGAWSAPETEVAETIRRDGTNPLMARSEAEFARTFETVMSDPPFLPRPMMNVMARERIRNFALEERIFEQITSDSVEARIAGLATPTLIVWGAEDRVLDPAAAEILHTLLPQSRVIVMPGVGHLPMLERPRQCGRDYLQFRAAL